MAPRGRSAWSEYRRDVVTPAFAALRARGVYASVQRLPCCVSCAQLDAIDRGHRDFVFLLDGVRGLTRPQEGMWLFHCVDPKLVPRTVRTLRRYFLVRWDGTPHHCMLLRDKGVLWGLLRAHVRLRALCVFWMGLTSHLYDVGGPGRLRDTRCFVDEFVGP